MDALTQCIHITAGEVEYCSQQIARLEESDAVIQFREVQDGTEGSYVKTTTDTQLHVWIRARHLALDALARFSKMAIDAGVSERHDANPERVGVLIGELLRSVLADLGLSDVQKAAAPGTVRRHLKLIKPWQSPWQLPDQLEESP